MGSAIIYIFDAVINIVIFLIFANAILSWLVAFNVLNTRNRIVYQILSTLERVVDPIMRPVRRFIPPMGGLDLSPIVVLILLRALQILVQKTIAPILIGSLG